jgi:hypothetical protein
MLRSNDGAHIPHLEDQRERMPVAQFGPGGFVVRLQASCCLRSNLRAQYCPPVKVRVILRLTVIQYVFVSSPLWDFDQILLPVLSLSGALSDERTCLQFAVQ